VTLTKLLVLVVLLALPVVATAFVCDDVPEVADLARAKFLVLPGGDQPAPLNTRVRVRLDGKARGIHFTLHRQDGGEVAAEQRFLARWGDSGVELVPRQPLAAGGRYVVRASAPEQKPRQIGGFSVGAAADTSPPAGQAVAQGSLIKLAIHHDAGWAHVRYLRLVPGDVKDDRTSRGRLLFWIWEQADGLPSAGQKAKAWLVLDAEPVGGAQALMLGQSSDLCADANYPLPKGSGPLRLVVRAEDEAGNLSEPATVTIDLAKAERKTLEW
jgi:hypothetical protein